MVEKSRLWQREGVQECRSAFLSPCRCWIRHCFTATGVAAAAHFLCQTVTQVARFDVWQGQEGQARGIHG